MRPPQQKPEDAVARAFLGDQHMACGVRERHEVVRRAWIGRKHFQCRSDINAVDRPLRLHDWQRAFEVAGVENFVCHGMRRVHALLVRLFYKPDTAGRPQRPAVAHDDGWQAAYWVVFLDSRPLR